MNKINFDKSEYFINRELSWLEFNDRVLEEARDRKNPLFERLKFLSIVSSNLDEFFMIRVASLKDQVNAGFNRADPSGLTPKHQLKRISIRTHRMVDEQYTSFNRALMPGLKRNGIHILYREDLNGEQRTYLQGFFLEMIYPVLTPMAVDSSRPFPLILNKSLNIGTLIKDKESEEGYIFATVQVPSVLPRLIELPSEEVKKRCFVLLEEVIVMNIDKLFQGKDVICAYPYRITRNADLSIEEEEAEDLLIEIEKSLKMRKWGATIRLEVDDKMAGRLVELLKSELEIHHGDIYYINGPLDLTFLMKIYSFEDYGHLKYPENDPQIPGDLLGEEDIFGAINKRDILLHHPYESFDPVVAFVKHAAQDPKVLAIKQTLYRVSGDSPIVKALEDAAERGKQVTVLVEVKARFDEENNIQWAKRLEKAGCHVIYGLVGLKTHCKIILVVRQEESGIKRYVHLGTGNYNDITAKFYTDIGMFTCSEYFGADVSAVFNMLSGYSEPPGWYKIETAPKGLRNRFLEMIDQESQICLSEGKGRIIAKMNSLVDKEIISALYRASAAGVKIDLAVRGICCLRTGIEGVSDNISVRSIVGRFLEHSRVFYFYNGGREDVYLSSADWMPRNLDRRVELLFPIEEKAMKDRLIAILQIILEDNVKARLLDVDGKYKKIDLRGKKHRHSQNEFCHIAHERVKRYNKETNKSLFEPILSNSKNGIDEVAMDCKEE
ncbi:RNA degradosome polyphosphate kinase [Geosporobacter ferrireducens]|uniref:Polyphosphate kinase n=1 Tax=Geosporobacter ferrireducens TaxID=1424294 RepID=A0A1D8GJE6_9FIRM|nr:RNA degradosome polyphosphate kinase [Geosporobacter ferrireducens]AOT71036.1 RNA degradosome polyphosphate kinase [Geosporobacter ferrireducens]